MALWLPQEAEVKVNFQPEFRGKYSVITVPLSAFLKPPSSYSILTGQIHFLGRNQTAAGIH